MEEKERYELTDTDCILDTERNIVVSDVCDVVANADIITDLLNQQDKRIKELEEENNFLEKRNEELIIDRRDICLERNDIFEENQQLKQQLAEKEKEISEYIKIVDDLHKQLSDKCDFCDKTKDQDKISFAVEQLEKVKDYFIEGYAVCKNFSDFYWNFTEQIDNQIKQLKEMK